MYIFKKVQLFIHKKSLHQINNYRLSFEFEGLNPLISIDKNITFISKINGLII
jgi:hypothetical protein